MLSSPLTRSLFRFDRRTRLLATAPLLLALALTIQGCQHVDRPDFSGSWQLDAAQSDFGPEPGPSQSTLLIEHDEPVLRISIDSDGFMGKSHVELELVTDGSEKVQTIDGNSRKTRTYWEEAVLVTEWGSDNPMPPRLQIVERRLLTADGQTMTVKREMHSSWAEWEQTAVFVRSPSGQAAPAGGGS